MLLAFAYSINMGRLDAYSSSTKSMVSKLPQYSGNRIRIESDRGRNVFTLSRFSHGQNKAA